MGKKHEDLLTGLKRTQAEEVHCSFEVVAEIIGEEEANMLALNKRSLSQKDTKERSLVAAMKSVGKITTENIATFDRAELLEIIQEVGLPQGNLESEKSTTALERLYNKMGKTPSQEEE
jgi:hypothetical protein